MQPFSFHIINEEGSTVYVIVVIAQFTLRPATRDFGVDEITEVLRERGITFQQGATGAPGICTPDIDLFVDEDVHVFDNEARARTFIRNWWISQAESAKT